MGAARVESQTPSGEDHAEVALEALPVFELIQQAGTGALALSKQLEARQRCVAHLLEQGFTVADTASVLRIAERTVNRDRAAIRAAGALAPTLALADELLGEFQQRVEGSVARLTRLANDEQTPPYARLWAEESIARIYGRFFDAAARIGYLRSGKERLDQLTRTDPREQARQREAMRAMLAGLGGIGGRK